MTIYESKQIVNESTNIFFLPYLSANGGKKTFPIAKVAKNADPKLLITKEGVQSILKSFIQLSSETGEVLFLSHLIVSLFLQK